jgi:tRNA (uracil-5-)-methyltransferase
LTGDGFLSENIGPVKFRIPPAAFFQTNSVRVVHLYDLVTRLVKEEAQRLATETAPVFVYDVCCGIGTIGLYLRNFLGNSIGEVVGIDIEPSGVEAAKENAVLNNLKGISFIASAAEKVLPSRLKDVDDQNIIAVVDPPRAGLHSDVTRALRNCPSVKSIVYVSCNPKSLAIDCVPLCKPTTKRFLHEPFVPTFVGGCDMFPNTELLEAVAVFQRSKPVEATTEAPAVEKAE